MDQIRNKMDRIRNKLYRIRNKLDRIRNKMDRIRTTAILEHRQLLFSLEETMRIKPRTFPPCRAECWTGLLWIWKYSDVVPGALLRRFIDGADHSLDAQGNLGIHLVPAKVYIFLRVQGGEGDKWEKLRAVVPVPVSYMTLLNVLKQPVLWTGSGSGSGYRLRITKIL